LLLGSLGCRLGLGLGTGEAQRIGGRPGGERAAVPVLQPLFPVPGGGLRGRHGGGPWVAALLRSDGGGPRVSASGIADRKNACGGQSADSRETEIGQKADACQIQGIENRVSTDGRTTECRIGFLKI